jgi:hypothetical protein
VQLVFDRRGGVRTLALLPDRRNGMPAEVEISDTHHTQRLIQLRDDCYEPVAVENAAEALRNGVEWRGKADGRRWRWVLSRRELYVLAPGDGVGGFVSTARLLLGQRHTVLATSRLSEEVLSALAETGCAMPELRDDTTPGVPSGWVLFREVIPKRAVPMRDEAHILNALCPLPDVVPHFVGGIRLHGRTWLAGFPPRIRFTGELDTSFRVMIDGKLAERAADGGFEVPGWDSEREHRLWFSGQTVTYALRVMEDDWSCWPTYDFGTGATICGAGIHRPDDVRWRQVRVPVTNPMLLGSCPDDFFRCRPHHDVQCDTILALAPFTPVWALPSDPMHADKRSTRIVLLEHGEPVANMKSPRPSHTAAVWAEAINNAARKHLALAPDSAEAAALWRRYRGVAKQLWRRMR